MKKIILAGVAGLTIVGSTAVYAHQRPWQHHHVRVSPEDRAALADARIAAVKAGLKLTPDQDKLWPPVEAAVRDFSKLRIDAANARRAARNDGAARGMNAAADPLARLKTRADAMATTATGLKRIADAADPLYKTLDEGQKRRLAMLTRGRMLSGGEGWREHRRHQGLEFGRGRDHRDERRRGPGVDGGEDSGRL